MQNQNKERTNWLQRHTVEILYVSYIISFLLMVLVIIVFCYFWTVSSTAVDGYRASHHLYKEEYPTTILGFFGAANAMVLFRVFGLNIITIIVHALILICVLIGLLVHAFVFDKSDPRDFSQVFLFPTYFLIALYILQLVMALHLVIFRPGRTLREREQRSGIHAFIGLITFIVQLWNVMLHISMICVNPKHIRDPNEAIYYRELLIEPSIMAAFMIIYVLLILFILLTPYFESEYRASVEAENRKDLKKNARRRGKDRRRSSSSSSPRRSIDNR